MMRMILPRLPQVSTSAGRKAVAASVDRTAQVGQVAHGGAELLSLACMHNARVTLHRSCCSRRT
jgi:hypothetical protein